MSTDLIQALNMLWQGMAGIFVVMALIAFTVYILSKIKNG